MTVQKVVLVEIESEMLSVKSITKKVMILNVRTIKNQPQSNSVTQTNAQSGKLASGANARKHVVVENRSARLNVKSTVKL